MKQSLIIADDDSIFVENLEEYIMRNHDDEFLIRTFIDKKYFEEFFLTPKKVDILLLNPKFEFEGMKNQFINNIVLISDDEESEDLPYDYIFRFGEITSIYNKIKNLGNKNSGYGSYQTDNLILDKTKVISVYSPIGGVGKSTIAMATAIELSAQGNKVLYLNLENMPTTNVYFNINKGSKNLSDIIDYLNVGGSELTNHIQDCIKKDTDTKVAYINPADNIFGLEEMNSDDIKHLINILIDMKKFTHIVIDTSSTYNTFKKAIIDISDKIITPIEQSSICREKVLNFLKYIDEEELYKFIPIINKYREEAEDGVRELTILNQNFQIQGSIDFYEPLHNSNSYMKIFSKHNPFTASIKSLIC